MPVNSGAWLGAPNGAACAVATYKVLAINMVFSIDFIFKTVSYTHLTLPTKA